MVAWSAYVNTQHRRDIFAIRLSASGQMLDTACFLVASRLGDDGPTSVGSDGWDYMVVWESDNAGGNVIGARATHSGASLDTTGFNIAGTWRNEKHPSIAYDRTAYTVAWEDSTAGFKWSVRGALVAPSGEVLDTFLLADGPHACREPALARGSWHQQILVYSTVIDSLAGIPVGVPRIWGMLSGPVGLGEGHRPLQGRPGPEVLGPNPFRRSVRFLCPAGAKSDVVLQVRNPSGSLVKSLHSRGECTIAWNADDDAGHPLPGGVYFVTLEAGARTSRAKLVLVR